MNYSQEALSILKKDFSNSTDVVSHLQKKFKITRPNAWDVVSGLKRRVKRGQLKGYTIPATTNRNVKKETEIPQKTTGLTEEQLRKKHDVFFIVADAAKKLKPGKYLTESEFVQLSGIRFPGYRDALNHPDNAKYRGKAGATTYWSHPESIKKLKSEGILN